MVLLVPPSCAAHYVATPRELNKMAFFVVPLFCWRLETGPFSQYILSSHHLLAKPNPVFQSLTC